MRCFEVIFDLKFPHQLLSFQAKSLFSLTFTMFLTLDLIQTLTLNFTLTLSLDLNLDLNACCRPALAGLLRFPSSKSGEGLTSLADYIGRMKEGQKEIYYMAADSQSAAATAPFVERLVKRDFEVRSNLTLQA